MGLEEQPGRDQMSSVSTILGLALFCLLIATILLRRIMAHRQSRQVARSQLMDAATAIGRSPGGEGRGDSIDDDEPRTIALGARAALLRRPIIWEEHISLANSHFVVEKHTGASCWDHLQPAALQLLTPHTTAHFPQRILPPGGRAATIAGMNAPQRMARAYSHFLFHRDHSAPAPSASVAPAALASEPAMASSGVLSSIPSQNANAVVEGGGRRRESSTRLRRLSASVRSQRSITAAPTHGVIGEGKEKEKEGVFYSHPVTLTFIICMPDPLVPSYTPAPPSSCPPITDIDIDIDTDAAGDVGTPLSTWIQKTQQSPTRSTVMTSLALGTTQPFARLPSLRIPLSSLDSWWDLPPSSPHALPSPLNLSSPLNIPGLSAGQMLQLENQRRDAERAAREREEDRRREQERERTLREGMGGRDVDAVYAGIGMGGGRAVRR